jgi:GNAT superfamily N-acetyltransferase
VKIRILRPDDAHLYWHMRLEALKGELFSFSKAPEEHATTTVEATAAQLQEFPGGNYTLGAFDADRLVGIVTFLRESGRKARHRGNIAGLYVTPSARRSGVGAALMEALMEKALKDPTLEQLNLAVTAGPGDAGRLYRHFGFETWGIEPRSLKMGPDYSHYTNTEYMYLRLR